MYSSTISAVSGTGMFSSFILSCGFLAAARARAMCAVAEAGHLAERLGEPDALLESDQRFGHGHGRVRGPRGGDSAAPA